MLKYWNIQKIKRFKCIKEKVYCVKKRGVLSMKKKRIIALLLIAVMTSVIVGCEKQTSKLETSKEDNKPEFKVVLVDKELKEYIEKARKNEDDIDKLYKETVYNPILSKNNLNFEDYFSHRPIISLDRLESKLDVLIQEDVENFSKDILEECNEFLPGVDSTVYIFPYEPEEEGGFFKASSKGAMGFANLENGNIILCIDPTFEKWKIYLPHVIAHEYHHIVWANSNLEEMDDTLIEDILLEGRADSFADLVFPDNKIIPPIPPIEIDREKEIWNNIKENLDNTDSDYSKKVLHGDNKEFPLAAGYIIGYNIVQEFIKNNPEVSIEEWTNMRAMDMLKKSGYIEKMENIK